jgi:hypothetical protein
LQVDSFDFAVVFGPDQNFVRRLIKYAGIDIELVSDAAVYKKAVNDGQDLKLMIGCIE